MGEFRVPLGKVETTREGTDVTVISYGSTWKIVTSAANLLADVGINIEVIDTQTLTPFDLSHDIVESIKKTNRLLVVDEDVPGGASAYIMQKIIEEQNAYHYLDSDPQTLAAKAHRPAYGKDGDYFSKPSVEDVFEKVYAMMHESNPAKFPSIY
jgi:pyruvate/2-oxoglutarate/acetoin dehydrogenase E1 component